MTNPQDDLVDWLDTAAPLSDRAGMWLINWLQLHGHLVARRPGWERRLPTLLSIAVLESSSVHEVIDAGLFEMCHSMDCAVGWCRIRVTSRGLDYYQQHVAGTYRG